MVATDDEREIILRSRKGDREAFDVLIRMYQRMIHSLCYRMTGSLDDADDLVQETFIQAYRHLDNFRAEARFSSWLYRIAINRCLNWRARQKRRERAHEQWEPETDALPAENDLTRQVQATLEKLPAKQRAAVVLTTYEGMNHAEAARILGCSEVTVSWRVFAARQKLKRWLAPHVRNK